MLLRFFVSTLLKSALIKHKILQLLVEFPNFCFVFWDLQCKMISFGSYFRRILRRNGRLLRGRRVGDGHFDDVMRKVVAILDQLFHVVDQDDIQVVLLLRIQPAGIVEVRWPDAFGIVSHLLKKRIGMYFFNSQWILTNAPHTLVNNNFSRWLCLHERNSILYCSVFQPFCARGTLNTKS